MHTGNSSQQQRQTLPQSKILGKKFRANGPKKKAGVTILIINKIDFQPKVIKKDMVEHFLKIIVKKLINMNSQS